MIRPARTFDASTSARRNRRALALSVLAAAIACAMASDPYAFGLRARETLVLAALALALAIVSSRTRGPASGTSTGGALAALAALAIVAFAGPLVDPALRNSVWLARCLAMLLASTAGLVALAAVRARDGGVEMSNEEVGRRPSGDWTLVLAVSALALALMILMGIVSRGGRPLVVDEVLYLFQAVTLGEPGFGRMVPPSLERFFVLPQSFVRDGALHGQYPLGWPLLLALGRVLAIEHWMNALFGAGTVALTFLVGRRIMPPRLALLAAVLVASNVMFVEAGGDYFAHASTTALILSAALLLLRSEEDGASSRARLELLAGLALGLAVSIRPLTGLSLGISLWLWMLIRSRRRAADAVRMSACLALGAAPMLVATLAYNHVVTGAATRFGYASANGDLVDLGFGVRGIIGYDRSGAATPLVGDFTPAVAARNAVRVLAELARAVLPAVAVVALLALVGGALRERRTAAIAASFLVLPALQSLYYYPSVRFYTELLPFAMLGVCALLARWKHHPAFVRAAALFAIVASGLSLAGRLGATLAARDDVLLANRLVERASADHGPIVVFVADDVPGEGMLGRLWWYNVESFAGPIVVVRDLGSRNEELTRAYPAHTPFRLTRTGSTDARLERLP